MIRKYVILGNYFLVNWYIIISSRFEMIER